MPDDFLDRIMRPSPEATGGAIGSLYKLLAFALTPKRFAAICIVLLVIGATQSVHDVVLLPIGLLSIWGGVLLHRRGY